MAWACPSDGPELYPESTYELETTWKKEARKAKKILEEVCRT